jgi:hypothetical protein
MTGLQAQKRPASSIQILPPALLVPGLELVRVLGLVPGLELVLALGRVQALERHTH